MGFDDVRMSTTPKPPTLQTFTLLELEAFTKEGTYSNSASKDFHLFYVGRDDVHGILMFLFTRVMTSLYLNMFGYDDDDLNQECMRSATDPMITTVITLDKSQSGSVHEKTRVGSSTGKLASKALRVGVSRAKAPLC